MKPLREIAIPKIKSITKTDLGYRVGVTKHGERIPLLSYQDKGTHIAYSYSHGDKIRSGKLKKEDVNENEHIVNLLKSAGYKEAGHTSVQHVRIATVKNPVFGGIGGKAATFGGRARYEHPSGHKATVGKRTVNFYQVRKTSHGHETHNFSGYNTKDIEGIKGELKKRHEGGNE